MVETTTNDGVAAVSVAPKADSEYHLGRVSRRILADLADTILPEEGRTKAVIERVVDHVDSWVPHMPMLFRVTFPLGLLLLQWGTIVTLTAALPFTLAGRKARRGYLKMWESSRVSLFRALLGGVRGLILSGYYAIPEVFRAIGYQPEAHMAKCIAKREELLERFGDVDRHDHAMLFEEIGHPVTH